MEHCYGAKGKEIGEKSLSIPLHVWETEDVADYPLFEPMLWNAYGVVVHSMDSLDRVRRASCVPSKRIYHPFYQYPENDSCLSREDLEIPDGKVVLLQYGHIVPNKNVHKLIEAICEYPETRDRVHLVVAGDYDNTYGKNIKSLIQDKGLNDVVTLAGHVSDSVLHSYIKNADLCINLRFPSTEGVSGSLIEQLYFRKPVVAAEVGFYAEMPDECILKLDSPISTKELADAVKFLVGDRNFRETLATKGGDFAHQYFSPEVYAKDLLRFIKEALSFKTSLDFIDRISGEISKFITSTTSEYFIGNISKELYSICDNQKRGTHLIV